MFVDVDKLKDHISSYAVDVLRDAGITDLFPPQKEALQKVLGEKNLILAMPTAAGKTLLAEIAMIREIIKGGKCLYVVPLRALASEKYESFKKWERIGIEVGISTGDYESTDEHLGDSDIIVTTSEKADSLIRNSAKWLKSVSCLVVDELHLLDSAERGATLEVLIVKMKKLNPHIRIIGLSATVPNADEIASWLNADVFVSDWRPVQLIEGVFCEGKLEMYKDGLKIYEKYSDFDGLVDECLRDGGAVLVFEATRRNAESTAVKLAKVSRKYTDRCDEIAREILAENEGEMSRKLAECVINGCAFHHAGLLASQRKIIEEAFRRGDLKVIVATPTLAAGVNLPARRVIVKTLYRYDGFSRKIKVAEYKQMAGRAGRPGMDDIGEAIVIVRKKDREVALEKYIGGEVEPITSKLGAETHLRFHSLSLVCEGIASSLDELESFFEETFFFKQNGITLRYELERVVRMLENWGMIEVVDDLVTPTSFGKLVSRLYIDPLTGFIFYDVLRREELTEIGALHLICRTPDMERLNIKRGDDWIEEAAFELRNELTYYPSSFSVEYDWFLTEVKTALCLRDWINEVDEDEICAKYSIAPGDLRRIVETAEWLSNAMRRIAEFVGSNEKVGELVARLRYGVKSELLPLVSLKGVGRVRARKLYNTGIKKVDDIVRKKECCCQSSRT